MVNTKINIGIPIDLEKMLDTRLLIQAGSGGGKSYLLRKHVESVGNKVQQIIIDPEGEFVTLREKYDFILISKDGDIPLSLKYAETLAHKLLETGVSAIIDLYELKQHERILFVKRFLDALMNAPKELWHSCFIYLDEAHIFCPESTKSESAGSVIDVCTRGRKRGFSAVLATQRLSKLNKDAAAECLNKMIGRTGLDIDRKRAGDELGFTDKQSFLNLRELEPGSFFAFGPAISNSVIAFKVAKVETTHLESGKRMVTKPPTPNAVKKILTKLADIPQEAEKELVSKQQMQGEITRLRTEVTKLSKTTAAGPVPNHITNQLTATKNECTILKSERDHAVQLLRQSEKNITILNGYISKLAKQTSVLYELMANKPAIEEGVHIKSTQLPSAASVIIAASKHHAVIKDKTTGIAEAKFQPSGDITLGKAEKNIIKFLAQFPERSFTKVQLAVANNYAIGGGGFNNAIGRLNTLGLLIKTDKFQVNSAAMNIIIDAVGIIEPQQYSYESFKDQLGKAEKEIYQVLIDHPHEELTKDQIAELTESKYTASGGGFNNAIGRLNTLQLIVRNKNIIRLNPELLEI